MRLLALFLVVSFTAPVVVAWHPDAEVRTFVLDVGGFVTHNRIFANVDDRPGAFRMTLHVEGDVEDADLSSDPGGGVEIRHGHHFHGLATATYTVAGEPRTADVQVDVTSFGPASEGPQVALLGVIRGPEISPHLLFRGAEIDGRFVVAGIGGADDVTGALAGEAYLG